VLSQAWVEPDTDGDYRLPSGKCVCVYVCRCSVDVVATPHTATTQTTNALGWSMSIETQGSGNGLLDM